MDALTRWTPEVKFLGVRFRVHVAYFVGVSLFFGTVVYALIVGADQVELAHVPLQGPQFLAVAILASLLSAVLHDLGHGLPLRWLGLDPVIELGRHDVSFSDDTELTRGQAVVAALCGLSVSAVVGTFALIVSIVLQIRQWLPFVQGALTYVGFVHLTWAAIHLLPTRMMDGGAILGSILGRYREAPGAQVIVSAVTVVVAVVLTAVWLQRSLLCDSTRMTCAPPWSALFMVIGVWIVWVNVRRFPALLEAWRVDRIWLHVNRAWAAGEYQQAYDITDIDVDSIRNQSERDSLRLMQVQTLNLMGRGGDALAVLDAITAPGGGTTLEQLINGAEPHFSTSVIRSLTEALLLDKRYEDALAACKCAWPRDDVIIAYNTACALARLGRDEEALHWLELSIDGGFANLEHVRDDEDLSSLHGNAKFEQLVTATRN